MAGLPTYFPAISMTHRERPHHMHRNVNMQDCLDLLCSAITNRARTNLGSLMGSFWLLCSRQTFWQASTFDQPCYSSTLKDLSLRHIPTVEKPTTLPAGGLGLCALKERHWNCKAALAVQCCPKEQCFFLTSGLITFFLGGWRCPRDFCCSQRNCRCYWYSGKCNKRMLVPHAAQQRSWSDAPLDQSQISCTKSDI